MKSRPRDTFKVFIRHLHWCENLWNDGKDLVFGLGNSRVSIYIQSKQIKWRFMPISKYLQIGPKRALILRNHDKKNRMENKSIHQ